MSEPKRYVVQIKFALPGSDWLDTLQSDDDLDKMKTAVEAWNRNNRGLKFRVRDRALDIMGVVKPVP